MEAAGLHPPMENHFLDASNTKSSERGGHPCPCIAQGVGSIIADLGIRDLLAKE